MADNQDPKQKNNLREGYDPEFEIPDPDQVEQDIKDAEKLYKDDQDKEPAA